MHGIVPHGVVLFDRFWKWKYIIAVANELWNLIENINIFIYIAFSSRLWPVTNKSQGHHTHRANKHQTIHNMSALRGPHVFLSPRGIFPQLQHMLMQYSSLQSSVNRCTRHKRHCVLCAYHGYHRRWDAIGVTLNKTRSPRTRGLATQHWLRRPLRWLGWQTAGWSSGNILGCVLGRRCRTHWQTHRRATGVWYPLMRSCVVCVRWRIYCCSMQFAVGTGDAGHGVRWCRFYVWRRYGDDDVSMMVAATMMVSMAVLIHFDHGASVYAFDRWNRWRNCPISTAPRRGLALACCIVAYHGRPHIPLRWPLPPNPSSSLGWKYHSECKNRSRLSY